MPVWGWTEIARTVCELLEWTRPGGGLKNHECRQLLEQLQAEGVLHLPGAKVGREGSATGGYIAGIAPDPRQSPAPPGSANRWSWLGGRPSRRAAGGASRWNGYHYLGCRVPFGANLRYWVRNQDREMACLLWTSPAWKMQARDAWIGWSDEQRQRNLQSIVNNGRFLILPVGASQRAGEQDLAFNARRMPPDWQTAYGHHPLLLGNARGRGRLPGNLLPGRQLDPRGGDHRARSYGSGEQTSRASRQETSMSIHWPQCSATFMRRSHPVNKYTHRCLPPGRSRVTRLTA